MDDLVQSVKSKLPQLRGRLLANEPLAPLTWFRVGGPAQLFFQPADEADLAYFLKHLPQDIRVTVISPGVTESELAESISDEGGRAEMREFRKIAIPAMAIARAIAYAVEQPADVDVSELIVRPTGSPF